MRLFAVFFSTVLFANTVSASQEEFKMFDYLSPEITVHILQNVIPRSPSKELKQSRKLFTMLLKLCSISHSFLNIVLTNVSVIVSNHWFDDNFVRYKDGRQPFTGPLLYNLLAKLIKNKKRFYPLLIHFVCQLGANLNIMRETGWSCWLGRVPLLCASYYHPKAIPLLINAGADVNAVEDGLTMLMHLCGNLYYRVKKYGVFIPALLVDSGADVNATTKNGITALMLACCYAPVEVVYFLLYAGADVNAITDYGETALTFACSRGRRAREVVELLIDYGVDVNKTNESGWTALADARRNNPELLPLLIEAGATVNVREGSDYTSLIYAILLNNLDQISMFLQAGADVNFATEHGETPLMVACRYKKPSVSLLLEHGADVNQADNNGETPLLYACDGSYEQKYGKWRRRKK